MNASRAKRAIAANPIAAFLTIAYCVAFATALFPPLAESEVLPFGTPLFAALGTIIGVGVAAFLVTWASDGRAGVRDLARRSLRWRVPVRWYVLALFGVPVAGTLVALVIYGTDALASPSGGWLRALAEVCALFVIQFVLFQFAEEVGWTGYFQHTLRERFRPLVLCVVVALAWAIWHLPDFFVEEGWTLTTLALSPVFFLFELVSLFFARALIIWLYEKTGQSVLLVVIFHASFDASVSELSKDVIPGSDAVRLVIFSAVIVVPAIVVIAATRGRLGMSRPGARA
jgi:uncharacterized protein